MCVEKVQQKSSKQRHVVMAAEKDVEKQTIKNAKPFSYWLKKNNYYHERVKRFYQFTIPKNSTVLHVNCKNGYLIDAVQPRIGVGIDEDELAIAQAQDRYSSYQFHSGPLKALKPKQTFEYIILSSATTDVYDIQTQLQQLQRFCNADTRIIVDTYSYLWEPILWLTQKLRLRRKTLFKNWISRRDLQNFLHLAGFEEVTRGGYTLLPMYIPFISTLCNRLLVHLPLLWRLSLHHWVIARPQPAVLKKDQFTVSVIVPCRNEKGNIEAAVKRCPQMGKETEIIFIEGHSKDGTIDEIKRVIKKYPEKNIRYFVQDGKGKGNAVRLGFAQAKGDVLMILDADLTMPPEDLPKFFEALVGGKGELINGSRLIYGMENSAMRSLNLCANFFFSVLFTWLLNQRVKDTLCGTKVLWKKDYEKIAANRAYFGNFDPFGDFDLLFGAAKLNLKIIDVPIHYKSRIYGTTQIRRFLHGWILLGMSFVAWKKLKLW